MNVLKVFRRTERPVALTTARTDAHMHKHKIQAKRNTKQMSKANNELIV